MSLSTHHYLKSKYESLAKFQALPLVGPFFLSPIVALTSTIHMVAAAALCLFSLALAGLSYPFKPENKFFEIALDTKDHLLLGLRNLIFSVFNSAFLGTPACIYFLCCRRFNE